jgi:ADP-ribose pyrophosphatase YjhB (NUDIX family)
MADVTFKTDGGYFLHKAGAIIVHDNKLLMVKNENFPYYYTVGGRVNFGETSEDAVLREVFEETGIKLEIDRLAFIHENYFVGSIFGAMDEDFHEVAFYYLMKQSDKIKGIKCTSLGADGGAESLHWLPLTELSKFNLYPEFYKTELLNLKNEVGHFITTKGHTIRGK